MNIKLNVPDKTIIEPTALFYKVAEDLNFPTAYIGKDSYIWNATINSGIEFTISKGYAVHNLQIGKFVSVAAGAEFCMGINHNYLNLAMGVSDLFKTNSEVDIEYKYKQKGQILIQNDIWLGHNVTVMPGVIVHNGAVIAANSHVVKDVPPYAIVGGNPAKVIKYRFSQEIIDRLLTIQWWNWTDEKIRNNNQYFYSEDINAFCENFYDEALEEKKKIKKIEISIHTQTYLFFPDFTDPYYIWEIVIKEFITRFKEQDDYNLIVYIEEEFSDKNQQLIEMFHQYIDEMLIDRNSKCSISVCIDSKENERSIFKSTDYFITNRSKDTVLHSCYADENNVKIISGVDVPIF